MPQNNAHSLIHRLAKLLHILSTFRANLKKNYSVLSIKSFFAYNDILHHIHHAFKDKLH